MLIKEIDVSRMTMYEVSSLREHYELQGYSVCVTIYEGLVDTWTMGVYE